MRSVILLFTIAAIPGFGAPIPGFYVTGVDASGNALIPANSGQTQPDGHYALTGPIAGLFPETYRHTAYVSETTTGEARWIGPFTSLGGRSQDAGFFSYTLNLDLTGFDPSTASITGKWAVDNCAAIFLNGIATANTINGGVVSGTCDDEASTNYNTLHDFSINSGFQSGLNALEFRVYNVNGPTGLVVTGTSDARAPHPPVGDVPEPGSAALLALGLAASYGLRKTVGKGRRV